MTKNDVFSRVIKHYKHKGNILLLFTVPFALAAIPFFILGFTVFLIFSLGGIIFAIIDAILWYFFIREKLDSNRYFKKLTLEKLYFQTVTDYEICCKCDPNADESPFSYYFLVDKIKLYSHCSESQTYPSTNGPLLLVHVDDDIPLVIYLNNVIVEGIND